MQQIRFGSKAQYALHLRQALTEALKQDSFNIFLHCVTNGHPRSIKPIKEKDDVLGKVDRILETGLDLDGSKERCPYGSISGVAAFMGEQQGVSMADVVDYKFGNSSRYINTIILAIPKHIGLETGRQEFSSLRGSMEKYIPFDKKCLLDISKEKYLPPEFTFGYQVVDTETGCVKFWQNDRHYSQLPREEKNRIMQGFAERITSVMEYCKRNHNTVSVEEVLKIMTKKHLALLDDYFNEI